MRIRPAELSDEPVLRALWEEFEQEMPEPPGFAPETWEEQWGALRSSMGRGGAVYVAEEEGALAGVVHLEPPARGVSHVEWAHVVPGARRRGVVKSLLREAIRDAGERGSTMVTLEVMKTNEPAAAVWRRLGFEEVSTFMAAPLASLEGRIADAAPGPSRASTHVQSDDRISVERAIAQFVPRLSHPEVRDAENGWIRIADPLLDDDRGAQSRLAGDLSDRLGAVVVALALEQGAVVRFRLYERGRMVDEYLSVPTYYGALPKGDELALAANPTLVARLTGADHDEVRRVARNAASTAELPPAEELLVQVARVLGVEP